MKNDTYRQRLYRAALDNHGLVTTRLAEEIGVPRVELRKLAQRSAIERIGHGVYRSPYFPATKTSSAIEALTLVGEGAFLYGQSVADYLELGDVNPRTVQVGYAGRIRKAIPKHISVTRATKDDLDSVTIYEDVPCMSVERTLSLLAESLRRSTLEDIRTEALRRGYLGRFDQDLAAL